MAKATGPSSQAEAASASAAAPALSEAKRGTLWDEVHFKRLSYWEQWDEVVRCVQAEGNFEALPFILVHWLWGLVQFGVMHYFTLRAGAVDESWAAYLSVLAEKAIYTCFISATAGLNGMYQGPLLGAPLFTFSLYRLRRGTHKEPLLRWLGNTRTLLDVLLFVATLGTGASMLAAPQPSALQAGAYLCCVLLQLLTDYACFLGADGMFHGPLALIVFFRHAFGGEGTRAAMQLWLVVLYVGCGIGKMGPWFACVFAQEWTTPPWAAGRRRLARLFYRNPPAIGERLASAELDLSNTRLARWCAVAAACVEWGAPLLLFATKEAVPSAPPRTAAVGVALLLLMHAYIVLHLPLADVAMLNLLPALLLADSSLRPGAEGFAYADAAAMHPLLATALLVLALGAAYGQVATTRVCYLLAYRFWAGNWPQGYYLVSRTAIEKMRASERLVTLRRPWVDDLVALELLQPWEAAANALRVVGSQWISQLCCRVMPHLMHAAAPMAKLSDYAYVMHCMGLNQWVGGVVGNCALRSPAVLEHLRRTCAFAPGELLYVHMDSFQAGGSRSRWQVIDASRGLVARGEMSTALCLSLSRPSLCAEVDVDAPRAASADKTE